MITKLLVDLRDWVDVRFPMTETWNYHLARYYAPKNFNAWYYYGSLALLVFVLQIFTGIFLTMNYKPDAGVAFASVEYIMRDVEWGWLIRYLHSTGASFFFITVYLHMFRGLLYGSYRKPRELLWVIGMFIYLALMAESFMGYLLPWGQMSYWGAQVILSLFTAIPWIGDALTLWVRGDYVIADATLNRFFAFHVILIPFILAALVFVHLVALHHVGSNNPDGIEIKKNKDPVTHIPVDGIPFHPYYTVKDIVGIGVFLIIFCAIVFFLPEFGGWFLEKDNFVPANSMVTPEHIVPLWYFTPFYAMLRAVPDKLGGVIVMFAAIIVLFILPWLDRSKVKSIRYKGPLSRVALVIFVISFICLGYLGTQPPTPMLTAFSQLFTVLYFLFFGLMPWYTSIEETKPEPTRVNFSH